MSNTNMKIKEIIPSKPFKKNNIKYERLRFTRDLMKVGKVLWREKTLTGNSSTMKEETE